MRSAESIFLRLERDGYPMDFAAVYLLDPGPDGPLPFADVRAVLRERLARSPLAMRVVARAPLRIGEDSWAQTDSVHLDAHVHHRVVPPPGDRKALLAAVLEVSANPLDRRLPLWEAWYLTGLTEGRAALVLRLHHAMIDGAGMIALQQLLFDKSPTPVRPEPVPPSRTSHEQPSLLRRAVDEVPNRLSASTAATKRLLGRVGRPASLRLPKELRLPKLPGYVPSLTDAPPTTLFNQHVSDPRKSIAVVSLPFEQVQAARTSQPGTTVNDVLLALVAGTMRDYLAAHADLPDRPIRTTCPVNVRAQDDEGVQGNHLTTMWVDLPVHLGDPLERLAAVHASSTAAKQALPRSQADWDSLADVGDLLLPGIVSAAMAFAGTKVFGLFPPTQNLSVSTLAGSRQPLYLATSRITNIYLRGIICPPVHLFFAAITYDEHINFTVTTVRQLCPDPQALVDGLRAELDRLLHALR